MPAILDRCVKHVMAKGGTKQKGFAVCTATLQKAGIMKRGTRKLTAKGRRRK